MSGEKLSSGRGFLFSAPRRFTFLLKMVRLKLDRLKTMNELVYRTKVLIKGILPDFLIGWYHFCLAFLAALTYRFPSKKLKVVGVTGTNGKSTVVEMVSRIFEEAGFRVASLSSIKFRIAGQDQVNQKRMTLPGRFFIQQFLRQAVDNGCDYAILEITSEGIKQHRHRFIDFEAAVFTNLTPEHIESHGSFEKYRNAKLKLFQAVKNIHVVNLDDAAASFFLKFSAGTKYVYGIDCQTKATDSKLIKATEVHTTSQGTDFKIGDTKIELKLLGDFNIYNALAAICVARSQGVNLEICRRALEKIESLPGRMEQVISQPFKVFVDYAFTPNALQKVYETLFNQSRAQSPDSGMICVFGACGGGRDRWKRPVLGGIAARFVTTLS